MKPVRAAARILLSGVFVASGARNISNPEPLVPQARAFADRVTPLLERTDLKVPTDPQALVRFNAGVQIAGGLLLASGRMARPAAALLAGSLVPTTLAGHPFWNFTDPAERKAHQIHFLKNLGLLGGLLLAAADTQGRPSLRWRASRAAGQGQRSVRRMVRTARRDARLAMRSATVARRLPG